METHKRRLASKHSRGSAETQSRERACKEHLHTLCRPVWLRCHRARPRAYTHASGESVFEVAHVERVRSSPQVFFCQTRRNVLLAFLFSTWPSGSSSLQLLVQDFSLLHLPPLCFLKWFERQPSGICLFLSRRFQTLCGSREEKNNDTVKEL